mgnify:CR=1 FL=1
MAGATNLNRRKAQSNFFPDKALLASYADLTSQGINVITATVVTNTAGVTAVVHSMGVTPGYYTAQAINGGTQGVSLLEHSAANNSVVGVRAYTMSPADKTDTVWRIAFQPPAV